MRARDWINVGIITLTAVGLGGTFPDIRGAIVAVWTLLVLGYCLALLGDRLGLLVTKSRFDRALIRQAIGLNRPEDLQKCEHSFGWKSYSPRDFDHEVRPHLAALVELRSKGRRDIDPELAALTHPVVQRRDSDLSITTRDLTRLVEKIEQL